MKIKGETKSLLLEIEAEVPEKAASAAVDEWLDPRRRERCPDIGKGATIVVRRYRLDGSPDPKILFRLDHRALAEKQRGFDEAMPEKRKRDEIIDTYRSVAICRMESVLTKGSIAWDEL